MFLLAINSSNSLIVFSYTCKRSACEVFFKSAISAAAKRRNSTDPISQLLASAGANINVPSTIRSRPRWSLSLQLNLLLVSSKSTPPLFTFGKYIGRNKLYFDGEVKELSRLPIATFFTSILVSVVPSSIRALAASSH